MNTVTTVRAKLAILLATRPPLVNAPPQTDNVWGVDCSSFFPPNTGFNLPVIGNVDIHGAYFVTPATIDIMRQVLKGIDRNLVTLSCILLLTACTGPTRPTLVEVAQARVGNGRSYTITDKDVLDYSNEVKITLSKRFAGASNLRYGASVGQTTLTALGAAASTAGWPVATASGLTAGSGFLGSLGGVFNEKAGAEAYETAYVGIQKAESTYYFYQLGGEFKTDNGKTSAVISATAANGNIPRADVLTRDGETLYYRVVSILKLLDDALAKKIPDLQTVKDAQVDSSSSPATPAATPKK